MINSHALEISHAATSGAPRPHASLRALLRTLPSLAGLKAGASREEIELIAAAPGVSVRLQR